jgi:hypothetical protein
MDTTRIQRGMRPCSATQNRVCDYAASLALHIFFLAMPHVLALCFWVPNFIPFIAFVQANLCGAGLNAPLRHSIRTACMQLLPLVEMYCRWELQEDCSNLQALMERFDSVFELETHDLGQSLLRMVRDEDDGLLAYSERRHAEPSPNRRTDPFGAVRARLAAVDLAFQGLQAHVLIVLGFSKKCAVGSKNNLIFGWHFDGCHSNSVFAARVRQCCPHFLMQNRFGGRFLDFLRTNLFSHRVWVPCSRIHCLPPACECRVFVPLHMLQTLLAILAIALVFCPLGRVVVRYFPLRVAL